MYKLTDTFVLILLIFAVFLSVAYTTLNKLFAVLYVENKAQQTDSDDVAVNDDDRTDDVIDESVDCDRDEMSDDVGDDNESDLGTNTHNELLTNDTASRQQIAEEQWSDETLKGCFKLAKAGKGGFELHEGGKATAGKKRRQNESRWREEGRNGGYRT